MKIVAFSDSHAAGHPSNWSAFFDKRAIGLFNHHYFRKHRHNQDYLSIMVDKILNIAPDIVICTGDISTSGEPSEFNLTIDLIKPLVENKSFEFLYVPGNHDYYVHDKICIDALKDTFYYLNRHKMKFDDLPYSLTVKGVNLCLTNSCKPINLLFSTGKMNNETIEYVLNWLENNMSGPNILVGHYPLIEDHPIMRFRHKLWGHKQILAALKSKRIDLSLCGHVHHPHARLDKNGRGEIIIGSLTRNGCFALIEYDEKKDLFKYNKINVDD
ncbi:MAG TPA: metallophosphoesterase [Victivallales bacterium]|nr:metallophosphoesterase [Victivallales bacterium]